MNHETLQAYFDSLPRIEPGLLAMTCTTLTDAMEQGGGFIRLPGKSITMLGTQAQLQVGFLSDHKQLVHIDTATDGSVNALHGGVLRNVRLDPDTVVDFLPDSLDAYVRTPADSRNTYHAMMDSADWRHTVEVLTAEMAAAGASQLQIMYRAVHFREGLPTPHYMVLSGFVPDFAFVSHMDSKTVETARRSVSETMYLPHHLMQTLCNEDTLLAGGNGRGLYTVQIEDLASATNPVPAL